MSVPRYPSAADVRLGLTHLRKCFAEVEQLQKAQIAQSLFGATVADRHTVLLATVAALGSLSRAITAYRGLLGLAEGDTVDPIVDENEEVQSEQQHA